MKVIALKGDVRDGLGKSHTKKLRKEGKVPCVIYGKEGNQHFSVYQADFTNLIYTPKTHLVQVDLGRSMHLAKIQDMQFHPVSEQIVHTDFYEIDPEKPISIQIPINVVGNSPGVREGGKLQIKIKKLEVSGLVKNLPEEIDINIDELEIGKSVKVKDISLDNLDILDSENNSIVSCVVTRAARSAADEGGDDEQDAEEGSEEEAGGEE